ncbi:MAG: hypothetical protein HKP53_00270 [Eudoraea sp.]|nr:hypothetical protein [Eudoraea sp.]
MKLHSTTILFLVLVLLLVTSCSKSSSEEPGIPQEQLEAISGIYNLTEYIISPAQDLNDDDVFSENLLDELDCLNANIILREDLSFSLFAIQLDITFITNEQYAIFCGENQTTSGTWDLVNNQIVLSGETEGTYTINGNVLTLTENKNLPDFQRMVFEKQ